MIEKITDNIYKFTLGPFYTNNYLLINKDNAILIDCTESYPILDFIEKNNIRIVSVFLTHGHVDHICGVNDVCSKFNILPYMNKLDDIQIKISSQIYRDYGFSSCNLFEYQDLQEGLIKILDFNIKVIHTPGHTEGSMCFIVDNFLFSGDTLFKNSVGRTDLIGGCFNQLINSIKNKIIVLDERLLVLPGHGQTTTIYEEKLNNPFIIH